MWMKKCLPVLALMMLPVVQTASAADRLYRCADGTFTNRVERQCTPYEPTGIVRVQEVSAESKQPFAEVKLSDEPAKAQARGH
jgi:hypothetical protein